MLLRVIQARGKSNKFMYICVAIFGVSIGAMNYYSLIDRGKIFSLLVVYMLLLILIMHISKGCNKGVWFIYENKIYYTSLYKDKDKQVNVEDVERVRFKKTKKKRNKKEFETMYVEDSKGNNLYIPKNEISEEDWNFIIKYLETRGENIFK